MTAIELQKPLSLGHVQASLAVTLAHRVFAIAAHLEPEILVVDGIPKGRLFGDLSLKMALKMSLKMALKICLNGKPKASNDRPPHIS